MNKTLAPKKGTRVSRLPENGDEKETTIRIIKVPKLEIRRLRVTIEGTTSLVVHRWSDKAKREMLGNQLGEASSGKERRDPAADFKACFYWTPEGKPGFPSVGVKDSAVSSANDIKLQKTAMRRAFHIYGEYVPIIAEPITEPLTPEDIEYKDEIQKEWKLGASMRSDPVRLPKGGADIRFRPQFVNWRIVFELEYNARVITIEQLVALFNSGGFGVGIGEHRCEKGGEWGRYKVIKAEPIP